jgi:hypothetical protein
MGRAMSLVAQLAAKSLAYASGLAKANSLGSMNSLVIITRRGTYDLDSREYDPAAVEVLYDDPDHPGAGAIAGVASTSGPMSLSLGDEPAYYSSLTIYIPQDTPGKHIRIDDVVHIIATPDNYAVGRLYRVSDVPAGGRIFSSIELSCTGIAPSKQWSIT